MRIPVAGGGWRAGPSLNYRNAKQMANSQVNLSFGFFMSGRKRGKPTRYAKSGNYSTQCSASLSAGNTKLLLCK
eukprot:10279238-Lingulodinium_polyedra.AAC.1